MPAGARHEATDSGSKPAPRSVLRIDKEASGSYLGAMRSVGLKILKNKLSEYVRLAAGGEIVLVTDRDRVVAEIVPPREGRSVLLADAVLAEAVRKGWITPASLTATKAVIASKSRTTRTSKFSAFASPLGMITGMIEIG